jgi:Ca-activated chloride channel family protein
VKIENAAVLQSTGGDAMVLQGVAAQGRLSGMLFELSVEQRYLNPADRNVEVVYTFPLAWSAVLLGFDVLIGGRKLTAVAVEKKAAEARYEEALEEGDSPIMVERAADGLYTVNLGNLMPGEEAAITYRYAQTIGVEQGHLRLAVPTVIAPRYGDPRESGAQPHQVPDHSLLAEYPFSIRIAIDASLASAQIRSPSHQVTLERKDGGVEVSLAQKAWLDRDFVLTLDGLPSLSAAVLAADGDAYVAMASFCPMPGSSADASLPRALKILVDCSGSMKGDSMTVAKRALYEILSRLHAHDCFSFSRFGNECEHLFKEMQPAQGRYLVQARQCLDAMDAELGGTEMAKALRSVCKLRGPSDASDILLITDGEIQAAEALVKGACAHGQRIFVVGVGSAPAASPVRRLAEATGGACELVSPGDQIEAAAVRMFERMRASRTTNVLVQWPSEPLWTAAVPTALYGGDTVHVFAGFKAKPEGPATLLFTTDKEQRMAVALPGECNATDTLPRLAASARLKDGLPENEALAIALKYQLVTAQTHLIVVHERAAGEKAEDLPALAKQLQMLAAGWGGTGSVAVSRMSAASVDFLSVSASGGLPDMLQADVIRHAAPKQEKRENLTPEQFVTGIAWDAAGAEPRLPGTIGELHRLGIPSELCEELERLRELGIKERAVVAAFLLLLLTHSPVAAGVDRHIARAGRSLEDVAHAAPELCRRMAHVMSHCAPHHWPERGAWRSAFGG